MYLTHLAAEVLLLAFSSSEHKRDFLVLFQTPFSWSLAVLCLPFGIVSFRGFLLSNVHVL